ncbi:hypothetical protein DFH06DRAFT_1292592 [Mycena polygramma]|nr:hypothetical protein DFH06DRAFT_1292592 [Mycena polygramma]
MFHLSFIPVVIVSAAIGFKLYSLALVESPMGPLIEGYRKSCLYADTNPFRDFICFVEPFFQDLMSNDVGKSFITAFGTSGAVMSTYLFLKGGEGGGSLLFSPVITIVHTLAGQVFGAGIIGPMVVPLLAALAKSFAPVNAPAPTPPTYSYTVTLLSMQFIVFATSMALSSVPPTEPNWIYVNYAFQGFPLLFIPLAFFPRVQHPDVKPNSASVSAFTFFKYLYAPLWWLTLAQGMHAYYVKKQQFTLPAYFMALDFGGFTFMFVVLYALDAIAGEAQGKMSVPRLVGGLLALGPASTMASYFEAKQRAVVEGAEVARAKKM